MPARAAVPYVGFVGHGPAQLKGARAMMAWITARRLKSGKEEEFRTKWAGGDTPGGMSDAYLLQDEEDPRNTLSISFWDTAEKLLSFRTSEDAKKREDDLKEV